LAAESLGLRAARRGGDLEAETVLLLRRADTYQEFERWADADEDLRRALALAGARGDTGRMCAARGGLGFTSLSCGRHEEAAEHYRAALPLARAAGDVRAEAVVECNLGAINVASGHYRQGLRHLERELLLRRAVGDAVGEAYALFGAALAWQRLAEHERAIGLIDHAVRLYRGLGLAEELIATALEAASRSYESLGRQEAAATALRTALTMLEELGDPRADALRARLDGRPPTRQ
jgi:tetratricopeptide (TPR) repeat protein